MSSVLYFHSGLPPLVVVRVSGEPRSTTNLGESNYVNNSGDQGLVMVELPQPSASRVASAPRYILFLNWHSAVTQFGICGTSVVSQSPNFGW